jgi:hypothetical protein
LEKKTTEEFSTALISKVPAELRHVADALVAPIDTSFDKAIDVYNLF